MAIKGKGRIVEVVSGVLVIVFTVLGLATLADRCESNVTKNTVAGGKCGGAGEPPCNAVSNKASKRV